MKKAGLRHLSASINSSLAGVELPNTKPEGQLTSEDIAGVISAFKTAVREAQQVPDSVLDKIHKTSNSTSEANT